MSPTLSVCVPSFRSDKIYNLYSSIVENFHENFELIVCGPYKPDFKPTVDKNLVFIKDYGSPARCCNIATSIARGKYITFIADDATYLNKSISRAIIKLRKREEIYKDSYKHVIVVKYVEGNMDWWRMTLESGLQGYSLNTAYPKCLYISDNWLHFNVVYMNREFFIDMGGYDSFIFETPHFAAADLAIRSQRSGCTTELMDEPTLVVSHEPGETGNHGPIYHAHMSDHEKYIKLHNNPNYLLRQKIDINNWKNSPEIWKRRNV